MLLVAVRPGVGTKAEVCFRRPDGRVEARPSESVAALSLQSAAPWRAFRWYSGQKHYSGMYWAATVGVHVIYESRLELARLLFADFDPWVRGIVAQPFLLKAEVEGTVRKQIPDYLVTCEGGPVVVDVKPCDRLSKPAVASTFAWTRQAVESRGWRYEVWSEPPSAELDDVRFLAGYRRDGPFNPELLQELRRFLSGWRRVEGRRPVRSWEETPTTWPRWSWTSSAKKSVRWWRSGPAICGRC